MAQVISCSNVRGVFPLTSVSGFVLSKCLQPSFVLDWTYSEENEGTWTKRNDDESVVSHDLWKRTSVLDLEGSKTI